MRRWLAALPALNWPPCPEFYNLNQAVLTEIPFRFCFTIGSTDNVILVIIAGSFTRHQFCHNATTPFRRKNIDPP